MNPANRTIKKILYSIANSCFVLTCLRDCCSFNRKIKNVKETQEKLLLGIIKRNSRACFGKKHNFSSIRSVSDFKSQVPISTFDSYAPYINLILEGEKNVLTKECVLFLQPSSGSVAASKFIPFTLNLRQEFLKGIRPWIFDLFTKRKKLLFGKTYCSVTPPGSNIKSAPGKFPVGFDDSEYLGFIEKLMLQFLLAVPQEVSGISDIPNFRYVTLLFLLKEKDLRFISIWNPTFLSILLENLLDWLPDLIRDIRSGTISRHLKVNQQIRQKIKKKLKRDESRARELEIIFKRNKNKSASTLYKEIWPALTLISCWADGNSAHYVKDLENLLPHAEIQSKGLIATEAFVSFPLLGESGSILSINSHFFEFVQTETLCDWEENFIKETKLAHELKQGGRYSVIVTTAGGLYRYHLQDIIEVVGFKEGCPLVRFMGKTDHVSDLMGEKLNAFYVEEVLKKAFKKNNISAGFFMLAPEQNEVNNYFYTLFIEQDGLSDEQLANLENDIEKEFCKNFHYAYCRKLGQLNSVRVFSIDKNGMSPADLYLERQVSFGRKLGSVKPLILDKNVGWSRIFEGKYTEVTQ